MSRFPDLVIFVPGILGSVLEKDGKTVWDISVSGAFNGTVLDHLRFDAPGSLDPDVGDGIRAVSVADNLGGIPWLWKLGGYSRLRQKLINDLGLQLGENYHDFPYDWRRRNEVASLGLAKKAHQWLKDWRESSGNKGAKIRIIAHSMGGLVSRHFIECLEGWRVVQSLTTVGTPHRGSGKAVKFLNGGARSGIGNWLLPGLDIARNFDSVYQLLPIYPFITGGVGARKVQDVSIPGISQTRAQEAAAFHAAIQEGHETNLMDASYRVAAPRLSVVVGTDQPTYQSASFGDHGNLIMSGLDFKGIDALGDGTVPRVSAIPIGFEEEIATFVCNSHAAIAGDKVSLHHIRSYLTNSNVDLDAYRSGDAVHLGLALEDCYAASAKVEIIARSTLSEQTLTAVIEGVHERQDPRQATLYRDDDVFRGRISLAPGLYRATIELLGRQVSDIFWVADT